MAQTTMDHRHLNRLYKCAECEFTVSHELMVYVLRHFFRCTSNKYVDELEVWSPPQLKIHGTRGNVDPVDGGAREQSYPSERQEEDSRTFADASDQRRASEDIRSLPFSDTPIQRGAHNLTAHHSHVQGRASTSAVTTKVTETAGTACNSTPVQQRGMSGAGVAVQPPMVWMVQPNNNYTNMQGQLRNKTTSSSSVTPHTERHKAVQKQAILQEEMCLEGSTSSQGKQQKNQTQAEERQALHSRETVVEDLCEEDADDNEEVIGLHLSCSPVPLCNVVDSADQVVSMATSPITMVTSPAGMNITQSLSLLQQQQQQQLQLQNPPFGRFQRGRPQKPPYSNAADMDQPKNTKRMNRWAVRVLNSWADLRNREAAASPSGQDQKPVPTNWSSMTVEQLDHWLSQFVSEVRRDDGQYYPYNTLYLMFTGINRYLRNDCDRKDVNILAKDDPRFHRLKEAMETQKKLLIERGIGLQEKRKHDTELLPPIVEARLWESKVFSLEKDLSISYAVFYYTSKLFGVSSGEEHHSLVAEQFSVGCDHMGRYVEFNRLWKKNKLMKVYAVQSDPYCPVLLYEVYLGYIPPTGPLYRRLQRDPEGRMYFGPPVGKNSLATYLNNIKRLSAINSQGNPGPHPTSSPEDSPATSSSDPGEAAKRAHSQATDGSEGSTEPSPKRIHSWNFDQSLSAYTALNQS